MTSALEIRSSFVPAEALAAYRKDGVVKLEQILSADQVGLLRAAVDHQLDERAESTSAYDFQDIAEQIWRRQGAIDAGPATRFNMERFRTLIDADPEARPLFDETDGAPRGRFFYQAAGWRRLPGIRMVALDSILPEVSAELLDTAYVNFWEDTTFVKTPGATQRTAFHQDYAYFQIAGRKCCIAWIALDSANETNGALEYVRGSHLWSREFAPNLFVAQTTLPESAGERLPDVEANREDYDIVRIDAEPGDVIFHDVFTVHGAGGNRSKDQWRRAVSFRYCGDDVRYWDRPGAIPQPWVADKPRNGAPLYSADYPRVWPRPFPGALLSKLYDD